MMTIYAVPLKLGHSCTATPIQMLNQDGRSWLNTIINPAISISILIMIVPSEEKLNDAFPPGSSIDHVPGSANSTQQQTYTLSSDLPFRSDYEPEQPPPAYEGVTNPGNLIMRIVHFDLVSRLIRSTYLQRRR